MNYLKGGRLSVCGGAKFMPTSCCRDALNSKSCVASGKNQTKSIPCRSNIIGGINSLCMGNHRLSSGALLWTQVRFQKCERDYPRFHNDLEVPSFDYYRKDAYKDVRKTTWGSGDSKPGYTYALAVFGMIAAAYSTKSHLIHYLYSMSAAADVVAMASVEIDISSVAPGECRSYKWRGKPLFIKHRSQADIDFESKTPLSALKDPETEEQRCQKPEWLIVIGICTHLGCVPVPNSGDWSGGFYCPCHGSHYDNIGRARRGPAPTNLEVPPYKFLTDSTVIVG